MHMMKTGVGIAQHLKSLKVLWVANSWRKKHTQLYNESKVTIFDPMFTCQNNHCTLRAWNSDQLKTVDPGKIPISCKSKIVLCISDMCSFECSVAAAITQTSEHPKESAGVYRPHLF